MLLMLIAMLAAPLQTAPTDAGGTGPTLDDAPVWRVTLDTAVSLAGRSTFLQDVLRPAGDVNRDGRDDFIVGTQSEGTITVRSGRNGKVLLSMSGDPAAGFGQVVGAAGDVDADGYDDIIRGEPLFTNQMGQLGRAVVTSGRSGKMLLEIPGRLAGDLMGFAVCGLGDLDGDGHDDIGVGSPGVSRVSIHSGADGALLMDIEDVQPPNSIGQLVVGAGDVDGDAVPDVLIGVLDITTEELQRSARVHSGADGSPLFNIPAGPSLAQIDLSMDAAGDVDGDGLDDIVVLLRDGDFTSAGVFGGADGALITEVAFGSPPALPPPPIADVAGAGDVDGDGHADILVGTLEDLAGGFAVFSGDSGQVLRSGSFTDDPHVAVQVSVQGGGDLNDDGFADLLLAIHQFEGSVDVTPSRGRAVFGGDPWFIRPGDRIRDRLAVGQQDSLRFDAVAGTRFDLAMRSRGKPEFEPALALSGPGGTIALPPEAEATGVLARIRKLVLPDTGTYSVALGGGFSGLDPGRYAVRTRARAPRGKGPLDADAPQEGLAAFLPGHRVQGTVGGGAPARVTVDLTAGSRLSLRARPTGGSALEPVLRVLDQEGVPLPAGPTGSKPNRIKRMPIPRTGTYTVEVSGALDTVGGFVMRTKARVPRGKARINAPDSLQLP